MSLPSDNNTSVTEYNKISKYKDLEISFGKISDKVKDKHIAKTPGRPSLCEIQNLNFVELLLSSEEYDQCDLKISLKRGKKPKKINTYNTCNRKLSPS